jgi:EAL domain-containing protein (putative c-di-GMP-specific phosphodiesterase class I)
MDNEHFQKIRKQGAMKVINREAEVKLIEGLTDIQDNRSQWIAICLAFSRLLEHYRSDHQIKIAVNLISDVVGEHDTTVFICDDSTVFILIRAASKALIDKLIFQLRYLFMDDPLAYDSNGEENSEFSRAYDLERSFDDFMQVSKARLTKRIKKSGNRDSGLSKDSDKKLDRMPSEKTKGGKAVLKSLNAASLALIERDLHNADLSKVLRRQPICAAVPNANVRKVFDELYINISHLRKILGVDVDLLGNRWLFKYLTQILDDRMLHLLQRSPTRYLDNPISLNLNIHTLLSERFAEFDESIKPAVKVSIVIEIQLADVFNDMGAFMAAKDTVQKLGYRVCLDGVTDLSFPQIDRKRLGFDLVKLQWNAARASELSSAVNRDIMSAVKECGVNRVILTRCDDINAIEYGQAMGISLFQGRYLDSLVNPRAAVEN